MPGPESTRPCRRREALALALLSVALPGCVIAPPAAPALQWVRLPATAQDAAPPATRPGQTEVWQLMTPLALPGHLDRDALLVPQGDTGLVPMPGVRWAEPLRDAVPRLLRDDLSRLLGTPVWQAPLPPGLRPTRQLRVELLAFELQPGGEAVVARARWSVAMPQAVGTAPMSGEVTVNAAVGGAGAQSVVRAHREALWRLARQIAAQGAG